MESFSTIVNGKEPLTNVESSLSQMFTGVLAALLIWASIVCAKSIRQLLSAKVKMKATLIQTKLLMWNSWDNFLEFTAHIVNCNTLRSTLESNSLKTLHCLTKDHVGRNERLWARAVQNNRLLLRYSSIICIKTFTYCSFFKRDGTLG